MVQKESSELIFGTRRMGGGVDRKGANYPWELGIDINITVTKV